MDSVFEQLVVGWDNSGAFRRNLFVKRYSKGNKEQSQQTEGSESVKKAELRNAVFVTGLVPQLASEQCLGELFSKFGEMKSVALHPTQVLCQS